MVDAADPSSDAAIAQIIATLATEIRRRRTAAGLSQYKLADLIGYSRQYVSMAERQDDRLPSIPLVQAIDAALNADGALTALRRRAQHVVSRPGPDPSADFDLASADLIGYGAVALGTDPVDFMDHTTVAPTVPAQVGWTDVEHVRAATKAAAAAENMFGGGLSCAATMAQLRWSARLLRARASAEVRRALLEAVGNLASVAAYAAFDISDYTAADRCFIFALWCGDQCGSWALRANTLSEMSRKAAYLGQWDEALSLIEFAQVRADRVSNTARAMMWTLRARLLALNGRHSEAHWDVDRADAYFHDRDPAADPPWLSYYTLAEHQGSTGKALIPVAQTEKDTALAANRLRDAITLHDDAFPRSRAFSRTRLAALEMQVGDPHEAVRIGRQALDEAIPLRSDRILSELHTLAAASRQHLRISDVLDLRHDITAQLPASTPDHA